jgi:hypothetical protein
MVFSSFDPAGCAALLFHRLDPERSRPHFLEGVISQLDFFPKPETTGTAGTNFASSHARK